MGLCGGLLHARLGALVYLILWAGNSAWGQSTIYVDARAAGTQTGTSWAQAVREIDLGVMLAGPGGEVWVARGTYRNPVQLDGGVAVYGGFAGQETDLAQRNPALHRAILDVGDAPTTHAVTITGPAVLDGLTITGGRAGQNGGGIYCAGGDPDPIRIARCTVSGNRAAGEGGGIYIEGCHPWIENCTITSNTAARGGGLAAAASASPMLIACTIACNHADAGGGAAIGGLGTSFDECTITSNSARRGGGIEGGAPGAAIRSSRIMHNEAREEGGGAATSESLTFSHTTLAGNGATFGGAVHCPPGAWVGLERCTLAGNTAERGGALDYLGEFDVNHGWLRQCTLSDNRATTGGALFIADGLALHGCLLSGNLADAGGALAWGGDGLVASGCTIADNAAQRGGAAYGASGGGALTGCLVTDNLGCGIYVADGAPNIPALRQCLFHGNLPGDTCDAGVLSTGPDQIENQPGDRYGNIESDPDFIELSDGRWTAPPVLDPVTRCTTLADDEGRWAPGELAGGLVGFGTGRSSQGLIVDNTTSTLCVQGDWCALGQAGLKYQFLDHHLAPDSAACGAGAVGLLERDLDGEARPGFDGWVDIGADEVYLGVAPSIAQDPDPTTVSVGAAANFTVIADGTRPLAYAWRKDGLPLAADGRIKGTGSPHLVINGLQEADEGLYSCVVANAWGTTESAGARLGFYRHTLHVGPALGLLAPPAGNHIVSSGSLVQATLSTPMLPDPDGLSQWFCAGFRGQGAAPAKGNSALFNFVIDQPSTITWQWKRQFRLDVATTPSLRGSVTPEPAWADEGATVTVRVTPRPGYRFAGWEGTLAGSGNPVALSVAGPVRASARLAAVDPRAYLVINGGAGITQNNAATLVFSPGEVLAVAVKMRLRNETGPWGPWIDFAESATWTLSAKDGIKTVEAQFQDDRGSLSDVVGDTILLDAAAPQSRVTTSSGAVAGPLVNLAWTATDTAGGSGSGVRFVDLYFRRGTGAWQKWATCEAGVTAASFDTRLFGGPGTYGFYSIARDNAGNVESAPTQPDCTLQVKPNAAVGWQRYR